MKEIDGRAVDGSGNGLDPRHIVEIIGDGYSTAKDIAMHAIAEHLLCAAAASKDVAIIDVGGGFSSLLLREIVETKAAQKGLPGKRAALAALGRAHIFTCTDSIQIALAVKKVRDTALLGKIGMLVLDALDSLHFCDRVHEIGQGKAADRFIARSIVESVEARAHSIIVLREAIFNDMVEHSSRRFGKDYNDLVKIRVYAERQL